MKKIIVASALAVGLALTLAPAGATTPGEGPCVGTVLFESPIRAECVSALQDLAGNQYHQIEGQKVVIDHQRETIKNLRQKVRDLRH